MTSPTSHISTSLLVRHSFSFSSSFLRCCAVPTDITSSVLVLQAIRLRYAQKEIYTYSGIVLIATNPFARVDSLYVPGMVQVYAGKQRATQAPHLFAIAEEAFIDMLRGGGGRAGGGAGGAGAGGTGGAEY